MVQIVLNIKEARICINMSQRRYQEEQVQVR